MSIRDFDPLLKKAANRAQKKPKASPPVSARGPRSYNAMPLSLGMGQRSYKTSDVTSAAQLGRALKPVLDEIARDFRDYVRRVENTIPQDLVEALRPTFELSLVYVPRDTGALAESGYLEVRQFRGNAQVEMGYGKNGSPEYAVFVHEVPYKHAEPTSYKFLERAINEDWANLVQRVTENVRLRLGG